MSNRDTVNAIYAAFGRGDIPAILEHIADDVDWDYAHPADIGVPYLVPGRGKAAVLAFFQSIPANLEPRGFEFAAVLGDGPIVVALVNAAWLVKSTGKTIREEHEAHIWSFDARGRVARFRHAVDTLAHHRAFEPAR